MRVEDLAWYASLAWLAYMAFKAIDPPPELMIPLPDVFKRASLSEIFEKKYGFKPPRKLVEKAEKYAVNIASGLARLASETEEERRQMEEMLMPVARAMAVNWMRGLMGLAE